MPDIKRTIQLSLFLVFLLGGLFFFRTPQPAAANASEGILESTPVYLPFITKPIEAPTYSSWFEYFNAIRTQSGLPAVTENSTYNQWATLHARYIVKNNVLSHYEDSGNPWYSAEGNSSAGLSVLYASYRPDEPDVSAIEAWLQAPFHLLGILNPFLVEAGYGAYRENKGNYSTLQMGAALDVGHGQTTVLPKSIHYPIVWPGPNSVVSQRQHWGESPSPLTSCPGYGSVSGLPIVVLMGNNTGAPQNVSSSIRLNSQEIEHCRFDETSYYNPNSAEQEIGRSILNIRDAIVLIPRSPLISGGKYTVTLTANGKTTSWSFFVGANAK